MAQFAVVAGPCESHYPADVSGHRSSEEGGVSEQRHETPCSGGHFAELTESVAILNYIARKAPESGLIPNTDLQTLAKHDELVSFVLAELEQPLWSTGKHMFALPEEQRIPQMFDTAKFEFDKAVRTLDYLLDENEFAIANHFSIVDILLAQTFNWAIRFEFDVPQKYTDLRNRHYDRAAAKRTMDLIK